MTTTPTDRHGFPLKTCTRCGGTGRYSFNQIDGDRCYGCSGSGWQPATKKAATARTAFLDAVRAARRPMLSKVAVGDVITFDFDGTFERPKTGARWGTVAAIDVDRDRPVGFSVSPDGERTPVAYEAWVWFDGAEEPRRASTTSICLRRGVVVDPAPFVAQARTR